MESGTAAAMAIELRFLGEMEVVRAGVRVELPPSKKTRALLAYLALTGRPHRRERLCSMLWDVADDPRGALRWSLSRLRPIVDDERSARITADRQHVAFARDDVWIDLLAVREAGTDPSATTTESLVELERHFRGELLEDLVMSDFPEFNAWHVAEREEARALHLRILRELTQRGESGAARRLRELDPDAAPELRSEPAPPVPEPSASRTGRLVGRSRELAQLEQWIAAREARVVLLSGEPGLGKSRLLVEAARRVRDRRSTVLEARAFEAESGRPYGPWVDALRQLPAGSVGKPLASELAPLLPELAMAGEEQRSRDRLFGAVSDLIGARAHSAPPVVLLLDDLQWLDASSAELLHFVVRMNRHRPFVVLAAAREGELRDNDAVLRVLRSLRREGLIEELQLGPLAPDDIGALVAGFRDVRDRERLVADAAGNPLYAIELARAGSDDAAAPSLARLVRDRLDRLPGETADAL